MIRRLRDLKRLTESAAETYGAAVTIETTNGSHWRVTFAKDGRRAFIIVAYSPHNSCTQHYRIQADARRALQKLSALEAVS
jgi:K+/H+ antiporter YhaU regulatory subunit KhtT